VAHLTYIKESLLAGLQRGHIRADLSRKSLQKSEEKIHSQTLFLEMDNILGKHVATFLGSLSPDPRLIRLC